MLKPISSSRYSRVVPVKGAYCLCIENHMDKKIKIGALGEIEFKKGNYIYIGSAVSSLLPRIKRHLETSQGIHHVTHWHIDYFLKENLVEIIAIYILETDVNLECIIAEKVSQHGESTPRFGCSDCKCSSHLYMVDEFDFLEKIGLKKWFRDYPRFLGSME